MAPSDELRRWYGHQPEKFAAFRQRYQQELRAAERSERRSITCGSWPGTGPVTLLTATRDVEHSQAAVLAEWLRSANDQ